MKIRDGYLPSGKGQFIYYLHRLQQQYGSIEKLVENLLLEGYQWASVRIQGGTEPFAGSKEGGFVQQELTEEFAAMCNKHGLEFHAWGYIYGRSPYTGRSLVNQEASTTLQLIAKFKPLSFTINDENKSALFKDRTSHADSYIRQVKTGMAITGDSIPDIPLGMSSFRFPEYHTQIPYAGYAPYLDFWAPQVYWQKDTRLIGPVEQLNKSIEQHMKIRNDIPFVPAGTVYPEGNAYTGWWTSPAQLAEFNHACKELDNVIAVNYWEYFYPKKYGKVDITFELIRFEWKSDNFVEQQQETENPPTEFDCETEVSNLKTRVSDLETRMK